METANFIFLERKWDVDKKILDDTVDYYVSTGNHYQILIFPEGTDKCHRVCLCLYVSCYSTFV